MNCISGLFGVWIWKTNVGDWNDFGWGTHHSHLENHPIDHDYDKKFPKKNYDKNLVVLRLKWERKMTTFKPETKYYIGTTSINS